MFLTAFPLWKEAYWSLRREILLMRIHDAIFSIGPNKAPNPDGIHVCQDNEDKNGSIVIKKNQQVFSNPSSTAEINDTLIVLIPKGNNVDSLVKLGPIRLCNAFTKG